MFVLVAYKLRHKILDIFMPNWNNKRNTLKEEKDIEFQKSLNEVEYALPNCNIYTYTNYHQAIPSQLQYPQYAHHIYEMPIPVSDL